MKALAEFATATGLLIIQKTYKPPNLKKLQHHFLEYLFDA